MIKPATVRSQIEKLTAELIEIGVSNRQNFPIIRPHPNNMVEVTTEKFSDTSIFLKNIPYNELYYKVIEAEMYNLMLVDGAIIQMQYLYQDNNIKKHRLCFLPSPNLEEFQNNPEIYEIDELFSEVISRSVFPAPLRFDFDIDAAVDIHHPVSHLTFGQYKNCRIPVSSALSPHTFMSFILRSFYNTSFNQCSDKISVFTDRYEATITPSEYGLMHVTIPQVL